MPVYASEDKASPLQGRSDRQKPVQTEAVCIQPRKARNWTI